VLYPVVFCAARAGSPLRPRAQTPGGCAAARAVPALSPTLAKRETLWRLVDRRTSARVWGARASPPEAIAAVGCRDARIALALRGMHVCRPGWFLPRPVTHCLPRCSRQLPSDSASFGTMKTYGGLGSSPDSSFSREPDAAVLLPRAARKSSSSFGRSQPSCGLHVGTRRGLLVCASSLSRRFAATIPSWLAACGFRTVS
jgi:hypothetical protein